MFISALFQPSIHPSRGKALETSPKENTPFAFERGTYEVFFFLVECMNVCWFMRSSLCEKSVKTGHAIPFPRLI